MTHRTDRIEPLTAEEQASLNDPELFKQVTAAKQAEIADVAAKVVERGTAIKKREGEIACAIAMVCTDMVQLCKKQNLGEAFFDRWGSEMYGIAVADGTRIRTMKRLHLIQSEMDGKSGEQTQIVDNVSTATEFSRIGGFVSNEADIKAEIWGFRSTSVVDKPGTMVRILPGQSITAPAEVIARALDSAVKVSGDWHQDPQVLGSALTSFIVGVLKAAIDKNHSPHFFEGLNRVEDDETSHEFIEGQPHTWRTLFSLGVETLQLATVPEAVMVQGMGVAVALLCKELSVLAAV